MCANNRDCGVDPPLSFSSQVREINIVAELAGNNTRFHLDHNLGIFLDAKEQYKYSCTPGQVLSILQTCCVIFCL